LSPGYGYSPIGTRCLTNSSTDMVNFTVIAAITKKKYLGIKFLKEVLRLDDIPLGEQSPNPRKSLSICVFYG